MRLSPWAIAPTLIATALLFASPPTRVDADEESVPLDSVPSRVLAAATRAVPGLVPDDAELETKRDGTRVYEIEGLADGDRYEVEVTPGGELLSVELEGDSAASGSGDRAERSARPRPIEDERRAVETFALPTPDSEIVSVYAARSGRGEGLVVVSPGSACGDTGAGSSLARIEPSDEPGAEPRRTLRAPLGDGEATSVAAHPRGEYFLVTVRAAERPNVQDGDVLLVDEAGVRSSIGVGPGPDSIAISPNGELAIVACEAGEPDEDDCHGELGWPDRGGSIRVLDLEDAPRSILEVHEVSAREIYRRFFREEPSRATRPEEIEPEFVAVAPDSSFALVTLQEQSAVVSLDLEALDATSRRRRSEVLAGAVLLPHDRGARGRASHGAHPDGIAISPDGSFAITANEADGGGREHQGISIIDLRRGPRSLDLVATHSIFTLDTSLSTGRGARPRTRGLPRLDPEGVAIAELDGRTVAAIGIERRAPGEPSGSVLLLDVSRALSGARPTKLGRYATGRHVGARPEGVAFGLDGAHVWVATQRDQGTLTRIALDALAPTPIIESGASTLREPRRSPRSESHPDRDTRR